MKIQKVEKLEPNSYGKNEYVIHISNLKPALNYSWYLKIALSHEI